MAPSRSIEAALEQFDALAALPSVRHAFVTRIPGIEVADDKAAALRKLERVHRELRVSLGAGGWPTITTEQIHGNHIATIRHADGDKMLSGFDGLITNQPGVLLGIHVADCCAVYLADPVKRVVGLVHSGKRGTEAGIVAAALHRMTTEFGSHVPDVIVQLSPCIRPPHYEIDFAATIREQANAAGVRQIFDERVCTACDLERFYSYRAEKGRTGRMLALIGLAPDDT